MIKITYFLLALFIVSSPKATFADGAENISVCQLIYKTGNKNDTAYFSLPSYIIRGIDNEDSLRNTAINFIQYGWDYIRVFKSHLRVNPVNPWGEEEDFIISQLTEAFTIPVKDLKEYQVKLLYKTFDSRGIMNDILPEDKTWAESQPDTIHRFMDSFCDYYFYIFKKDETLNKAIEELNSLFAIKRDEQFEKVMEVISKAGKEKWLVITLCTC